MPMAKALSIIQAEHRTLGALLLCFERLVQQIDAEEREPDFEILRAINMYLDSFLDRYHHPKEDRYLFPAVAQRCPEAEPLIAPLQSQHREGQELAATLKDNLAAFEGRGSSAFAAYRDSANRVIVFERRHAHCEERELLPLAHRHLTDADWGPIAEAFAAHDDPLFGGHPEQHFRRLSALIMNMFLVGEPLL